MCLSVQVVLPPALPLLVYNKNSNGGNISFTSELNVLQHVNLSWGKTVSENNVVRWWNMAVASACMEDREG